jgi:hypothetical protein
MYLGNGFQVRRKDGRQLAVLRATRTALFVRKTFTLTPPKVDVSFNLHTTAGVSYRGKPPATQAGCAASLLPASC